jgi:low affinity Fe/Cu permease
MKTLSKRCIFVKKRFIAFYDALCFSIIASVMWTIAIIVFITGQLGDFDWCVKNWYLVVLFAICVAVPVTIMLSLQKMSIDLSADKIDLFYLINYTKNDKDLHSNWIIYPSEIESIEIVKLSKEEKKKYTSARFLFSKYLKIKMKWGHTKYVYISHYSNTQINKIIEMLSDRTM